VPHVIPHVEKDLRVPGHDLGETFQALRDFSVGLSRQDPALKFQPLPGVIITMNPQRADRTRRSNLEPLQA
jgi:hypothetical protein